MDYTKAKDPKVEEVGSYPKRQQKRRWNVPIGAIMTVLGFVYVIRSSGWHFNLKTGSQKGPVEYPPSSRLEPFRWSSVRKDLFPFCYNLLMGGEKYRYKRKKAHRSVIRSPHPKIFNTMIALMALSVPDWRYRWITAELTEKVAP